MKLSKEIILASRNYKVSQANAFIETRRFLSEQEQDIIMIFISKIKPTDIENPDITVTIDEFCGLLGWKVNKWIGGKNYRMIESTMKALNDKSAWVDIDNGRELIRWFDRVILYPGAITVRFYERLQPFLVGLKEKFTQAALISYLALKSMYAKRLYELLKKEIMQDPSKAYGLNFKEYSISELRDLMFIEEGKYRNFADFKKNVLNTPIAQINAVTDLDIIDYEPNRIRGATHITFKIKMKEPTARIKAEANAHAVLDGKADPPKSQSPNPEAENETGQMSLDKPTSPQEEKVLPEVAITPPTAIDEVMAGQLQLGEDDGSNADDEGLALDDLIPDKWRDCKTHRDLLKLAKKKGYKVGWAYNKAKELKLPILPQAEQKRVYGE